MADKNKMEFEHYIVFDLEWNQSPFGKERENSKLPFEIIEIGAVKLNKNKEIIDEFHSIIRPMVYKKMHFRTKEIIGMDIQTLEKGGFFYKVIKDFLQWCKDDAVFSTWGSMDLVELQRNMKYYGLLELLQRPIHFFDVQKLFSIAFEDGKSRKSLEYGIDHLNIQKERDFHRALSDAYYTADILGMIDDEIINKNYSIDSYQNPKTKEEEIFTVFERYSKYISREFKNKEDAMKDREITSTKCFLCEKNARKKIRWFSINAKNYYCVAQCPRHGYLKGKARMKKTDEGNFYVVKTLKITDEAEVEMIREKHEMMKKKRRQKRKDGKSR